MTAFMHERLRALRSAEQRVQPDEAWVRATRETLLMQARNSLPAEQMSFSEQAKHVIGWFAPKRIAQVMRGPVMATISIFVVAFGGSIASVSAAERALPGDFLYSLKLATEQARLALTSTKGDKLKLKIEFTSRRGDELKQVSQTDIATRPQRVEQTAEILKRDLDTVKQQLDDVKQTGSPQEVVDAAKLVDHTSNTLVQQLQDSKTDLSNETKDKVTLAQAAAADTGVKAIEMIVEKHKESDQMVSTSDVVEALQDHTKTVADAMGSSSIVVTSTMAIVMDSGTSTVSLDKAVQEMKTATLQAFATTSTNTIAGDLTNGGATGTSVLLGGTASSTNSTGSTTSTLPITTNSSTKPSS